MNNAFAFTNPNLIKEWDKNLNIEINPDQVTAGSSRKVWWICPKGHSYSMRISHRVNGHGCPYCAGEKPIVGENDLATTNPELADEWHPTKNGTLTPSNVMRYTNKKVWWLGKCGHEWEATIAIRTSEKAGCPICNPSGTSFPEQALIYYIKKIFPDACSRYKKNGVELDVYIEEVEIAVEYDGFYYHKGKTKLAADNKKDRLCFDNQITLIRIREEGLPHTSYAINIERKKPFGDKSLKEAITEVLEIIKPENEVIVDIEADYADIRNQYIKLNKEKSLAILFPDIAKEWDLEKNHPMTAFDVLPNANRKAWWLCNKGHSYKTLVSNRVNADSGCPYCSGHKAIVGETDLFSLYPELKNEWDYIKNVNVNPTLLSGKSGIKVWWKCKKCDYSWMAVVCDRTGKEHTGCPVCSGKTVWPGHNDLQTVYPHITAKWDYSKNQSSPNENLPGSSKKVWWICEKGHSYKKSIYLQVKNNSCPICSNRSIVLGENDLFTKCPSLKEEWDYDKNEGVDPENEGFNSQKKVWWKCKNGHEWQTAIRSRTDKLTGCPYCSGKRLIQKENDLLTTHKELAAEWDYEKNNDLSPTDVTKSCNKMIWWKCSHGHQWEERVSNRTRRNTKCPYCYSRRLLLKGVNDLCTTEPHIAAEWDYSRNGDLKPEDVMVGSSKKVWWICKRNHSYYSSINMRSSRGLGCPYCSGQKVLKGFNDLITTHPFLLNEWDFEKNEDISPYEVSRGSNKKVWWKCSLGHEYQALIINRTRRGDGCPFCSGHKVLPGFNDLETTKPELVEQWDFKKNIDINPSQVSAGSNRVVWWICKKNHSWQERINLRKNRECPMCRKE